MTSKHTTLLLCMALTAVGLMGCPSSKSTKQDKKPIAVTGESEGVSAFKVGDLLVIHKPIATNDIVSLQLYFKGGSGNLTTQTQGIEKLALNVAASGGTKTTAKDQFNSKLDAVGASIGSFTDRDYSGFAMKTISPYFDDVFDLFLQVLTEPAMPQKDIDLAKKRQIAQYNSIFENNDSLVGYTASQLLFTGHPYANTQLGTKASIEGFTRDQLIAHQRALLDPKQMFLVVVGNVDKGKLTEKLKKTLGMLKVPPRKVASIPQVKSDKFQLKFVQKPSLPTNYVFGLFPAPNPSNKDYPAMVVAMDYLSDRLFEEVRTKRNLTYAVSAGISSRRANYGYLYVTAAKPDDTLPVIYAEVDKLAKAQLSDQQIKETLNVFLTQYYMSQETNSSQASLLADAYIQTGDWRNAQRFLNQLQTVKPADIQRVVKTYVKNVKFGVVGSNEGAIKTETFKR